MRLIVACLCMCACVCALATLALNSTTPPAHTPTHVSAQTHGRLWPHFDVCALYPAEEGPVSVLVALHIARNSNTTQTHIYGDILTQLHTYTHTCANVLVHTSVPHTHDRLDRTTLGCMLTHALTQRYTHTHGAPHDHNRATVNVYIFGDTALPHHATSQNLMTSLLPLNGHFVYVAGVDQPHASAREREAERGHYDAAEKTVRRVARHVREHTELNIFEREQRRIGKLAQRHSERGAKHQLSLGTHTSPAAAVDAGSGYDDDSALGVLAPRYSKEDERWFSPEVNYRFVECVGMRCEEPLKSKSLQREDSRRG